MSEERGLEVARIAELEAALLDAYTLLPPERVHLVHPASREQIKKALDA